MDKLIYVCFISCKKGVVAGNMKILVISDSHGAKNSILQAVRKEFPDYILHLGDYNRDCSVITELYPDTPLRMVKGNSDGLSSNAATDGFILENKRFLITHGHIFYVKSSLQRLRDYANEQKPDIVLFGHTHIPYKEEYNNILFLNPGSIGYGMPKKYAIITINDGIIDYYFKSLI